MKKKIIPVILIFILGVAGGIGLIYAFPNFLNTTKVKIQKDVTITDSGISDAVEKVYDAVVVVTTYNNGELYGSGTGFVYKVDGKTAYILTNNHVISSASSVTVTFTNGEVYETNIVGSDSLSDIAILSLDKKNIISIASLGSSENAKTGDTAFAVGAPLNSVYSWTVTRGIISGKDRMVEVSLDSSSSSSSNDYVMKVLQTDAAINAGNSGGPLCNSNGEVIGITSLKLVDESVEGMGFAIPIETATKYAEILISGEKITQPYLGVAMINVSDGMYYKKYYDMLSKYNITSGVIINEVESGSPSDKAGLKSGDIIVKLDDNQISNIAYLRYYLYNYAVGDTVEITFIRNGKTKNTKVTLGENKTIY